MTTLACVLAFLVGLSLGTLGSGGSILTVPILVYVAKMPAREAVALSLAVVGTVSAIGAFRAWREGRIRMKLGLTFAATTMAGTWLGAMVARLVSDLLQLTIFGAVMLVASGWMLYRSGRHPHPPGHHAHPSTVAILARGLGVGLLTGLVGVGGGFMIVPALVLLGHGMSMRDATGTSLMVIALSSLVGFLGYMGQTSVDWAFGAVFTASAVLGILVGGHVAARLRQHTLQVAFGWFLLGVAIFVLATNLPPLLEGGA